LVIVAVRAVWANFQIPPPPENYVLDEAGVLSAQAEARLNAQLEAFDRESSTQIVVAIFRRLPEDTTLEEFTVETAQAWGVGRKKKDNGAVLFVFVENRKLRIEVGYGLEGTIPDATARRIIDEVVTPRLRLGDFDGAISAGAQALIAAARSEFAGDDRVVRGQRGGPPISLFTLFIITLLLVLVLRSMRAGVRYTHGRRRPYNTGPFVIGGGGRGGGFKGGGGFGGGFSGGGGGFGGGGASGGW
jgi:uncharacterized protein